MEAGEEFGGAQMLQAFEALEDPRSRQCTYPLQELLLVALSAVTSGADDWVSVVEWAQLKLLWLRRFLPFDNGIASHDTFSRVFSLLDAQCFEACFVAWMRSLCPSLDGHVVAIDGKSLRGSRDSGVNMAHLVAAYSSSAGVALGQVRTARKSNEITAIPALLDVLDVQGATITMDACGLPARHRGPDCRQGRALRHRAQEQPAQSGASGGSVVRCRRRRQPRRHAAARPHAGQGPRPHRDAALRGAA
jgi:hypothetical protein